MREREIGEGIERMSVECVRERGGYIESVRGECVRERERGDIESVRESA